MSFQVAARLGDKCSVVAASVPLFTGRFEPEGLKFAGLDANFRPRQGAVARALIVRAESPPFGQPWFGLARSVSVVAAATGI